jgi:hypothetical protein
MSPFFKARSDESYTPSEKEPIVIMMLSLDIGRDSWCSVLLGLIILICVLPSVIMIKTEAVASRILIYKIDHLFYGELAGEHQTSIKFHNGN